MKPEIRAKKSNRWPARRAPDDATLSGTAGERRTRADRRHRTYWSVVYGGFHPRRRNPPRRPDDARFHSLDWHAAHLLAVAIGIMLLSAADAFLTIILLSNGADEVNPIMAALVYRSAAAFAALKIGMTAAGVVFMVFLARYRFMRVLRVEVMLYSVLVAYFCLIGYELWMLKARIDPLIF